MMMEEDSSSSSSSSTSNANAQCVGPQSADAGKASTCAGCPNQSLCASNSSSSSSSSSNSDSASVKQRLSSVKHKLLVLSGKGGVGKSTFSAQLAFSLAQQHRGLQVGLLDVDICGPSIPRMLGLEGHEVHQSASGWSPVYVEDNLAVMSIGFMLPGKDDAVIWRGPRKNGIIKQFLTDVVWGELDYLIIDTPPGTSDEHISIVQLLKEAGIDGAVVVTTPQEVSMADVRKELNFCRKTGVNVLGLVENMADIRLSFGALLNPQSGIRLVNESGADVTADLVAKIQSNCPELFGAFIESHLFKLPENCNNTNDENTPQGMARKFRAPYLGKLPMDPNMMRACEEGKAFLDSFPESVAAKPFQDIVEKIIALTASS